MIISIFNIDFNVLLGAHSYSKIQSLPYTSPYSGPLLWGHHINILMCIFLDDWYVCVWREIQFVCGEKYSFIDVCVILHIIDSVIYTFFCNLFFPQNNLF